MHHSHQHRLWPLNVQASLSLYAWSPQTVAVAPSRADDAGPGQSSWTMPTNIDIRTESAALSSLSAYIPPQKKPLLWFSPVYLRVLPSGVTNAACPLCYTAKCGWLAILLMVLF